MSLENKHHLSTVEVLRGTACMMVVVFHFSTQNSYYGYYLSETNWLRIVGQFGWLGVQVFFVISGFVIPYSLWQGNYSISNYGDFLKKRWWRLWPPYAVSVLLALCHAVFHTLIWGNAYNMEWMNLLLHMFYIPTMFGYDWYNVLYWTLSIEFQFYLVIGLLFPLLIHSNKMIRILVVMGFALSFFLLKDNRFLTSQSSLFVFGLLAFLLYIRQLVFFEFILLIVLNSILTFAQYTNDYLLIGGIALASTFLILYTKIDSVPGRVIGKISYSLYLIHGIIAINILMISMRLEIVRESEWLRTGIVILSIVIAVGISYCYWYLIEKPSQKRSSAIRYR